MTSLDKVGSTRTLQPFEVELCKLNRPKSKKSFKMATIKPTHSSEEMPKRTLRSLKTEQLEPSKTQVWTVRQGSPDILGIFTKAQQIFKPHTLRRRPISLKKGLDRPEIAAFTAPVTPRKKNVLKLELHMPRLLEKDTQSSISSEMAPRPFA
jgi:hypothetical protein